MPAITETHKAANDAMARYWLQRNGFQLVSGRWMDSNNRWARREALASGRVMIYVGGGMKIGYEKLWQWFGSSRASFLVIPRVLMHEMPDEWQSKMADLLDEYDNAFDTSDVCDSVNISAKTKGKFSKLDRKSVV